MLYRNKLYKSSKEYFGSTPRHCDPTTVWRRMSPCLDIADVTRLGLLTGMTRLKIPCAAAYRPSSLGPAPAFGKGLTDEQALLSAGMEAIERYAGETYTGPIIEGSYKDLSSKWTMISQDRLPLTKHTLFLPSLPLLWTPGWDIISQKETLVPLDSVVFGTYRTPESLGVFESSTNGLAAGCTLVEAVSQAIYEVIERDALACTESARQATGLLFPGQRVYLKTIEDQFLKQMITQCIKAGFEVAIFDCTVDTATPVYTCYMMSLNSAQPRILMGSGAALAPKVAMCRAVTEAGMASSGSMRLGLRESRSPDATFITALQGAKAIHQALQTQPETISACRYFDQSTDSFHGDVAQCAKRLQAVGLEQIIVFDITPPLMKGRVAVAKVVIPGLEPPHELEYARGGRSLCSYLEAII